MSWVKNINIINENIKKCNLENKIKFNFYPKVNQLDRFLEIIKSFGKIYDSKKYFFRELPLYLDEKRKFIYQERIIIYSLKQELIIIFVEIYVEMNWINR